MTSLYLISPPRIDLLSFAKSLEEAFSGGPVASFQLRLKEASDAEIIDAIDALLPICQAHDCVFILNDRPDLAAKHDCDGVHLGQEDLQNYRSPLGGEQARPSAKHAGQAVGGKITVNIPPTLRASKDSLSATPPQGGSGGIASIRHEYGDDFIIGVSCHASKHLAMEAGEQGADYVAFGAFYPTQSKPMEKLLKWGTPTPEILQWCSEYTTLPSVAIGGITPANAAPLVAAGADFIAVITAVWNHPQGPKAGVAALCKSCGTR